MRGLIIVLVLLLVGGGYYLITEHTNLQLAFKELNLKYEELARERDSLAKQLTGERERNDAFSSQISEISDTVNVLEKIKNTDPELLRKYSKVYFLNENYVPAKLTNISSRYLYQPKEEEKIHTNIWPHLREMLQEAEDDDVDLKVVSAYRSFFEQYTLKTNYKVSYGSGANQFSADQGYSEHQLGAAVDLTVEGVVPTTLAFEQTEAYTWLLKNAYKYGFILSYPKGNEYYQFEPWHWRFVGVELATKLHRDDKYFYDLDQRQINEYIANFFD